MELRNYVRGVIATYPVSTIEGPKRRVTLKVVYAKTGWYVELRASTLRFYTIAFTERDQADKHAKRCTPHLTTIAMCREAGLEDKMMSVLAGAE